MEDYYVECNLADEEVDIAEAVKALALRLTEWRYGASEREKLARLHYVVTPTAEAAWKQQRDEAS